MTTTLNHSPTDDEVVLSTPAPVIGGNIDGDATEDCLAWPGMSDDLLWPWQRVTIFWWAPFDRPIVLTALGTASVILALWATPTPVQLVGLLIAVISLPTAGRLCVRELATPRAERGCDVIVNEIGGEC